MKILAFADTHGKEKAMKRLLNKGKDVDLLVCAGDISIFGHNLLKLIERFKVLNKTMLILHGNHESKEELIAIAKAHPWVIFLHRMSYQLGDYYFFGYGGDGFAKEDPEFKKVYMKFLKTVKKNGKVILITHGPPYGTKCDFLTHIGHVGCKTYTKVIEKTKPLVHICGHLHETDSMRDKIGNTLVINPGAAGKILRF